MFKAGAIVKHIDDAEPLKVVKVDGDDITVEDDHGFQHVYMGAELILVSESFAQQVISNHVHTKDKSRSQPKPVSKKKSKKEALEYDLHAGVLIGNTAGLTPHDILEHQIEYALEMIEKARRTGDNYLVFVHGRGKGRLKKELQKALKRTEKVEFYDAEYSKYGLGATEVKLF